VTTDWRSTVPAAAAHRGLRRHELRIDVVILACAVSAGIHGALVRDHFEEGTGPGVGFVLATVLLAVLAVVLTRNPSRRTLLATIAVLAGLIVAYVVVLAIGLPVFHPERETVDGLALFTKAVEAVGIAAAASLLGRPSLVSLGPKGTLA
jgi:drug/metabolite transporter (DMT)-like permease